MIRRLALAFRSPLGIVLLTFLLLFTIAGGVYSMIEGKGPIEGQWWAIVTGSTTGYGDQYPVTMYGRLTAAILMVATQWWLTPIWTALLVVYLMPDPNEWTHAEQEEVKAELREIKQLLLTLTPKPE